MSISSLDYVNIKILEQKRAENPDMDILHSSTNPIIHPSGFLSAVSASSC
jgi:hypothetical protein